MSALFNATPKDANGVIQVTGTAAPSYYTNGLPYDSSGALATDTTSAISHYHQGLPFTAAGRLCTTSASVDHYGSGAAPLSSAGRLCMGSAAITHYSSGVPYISTGAIASSSGTPVFTPASLFASGEQGCWFDASDFSTMFQDSAGTVPVTAVGQPVGKMLDKSGRGNHRIQATTTKRPILSARLNLLVYSEVLTNIVWQTINSAAVTDNAGTDPLGGNTADRLLTPASLGSGIQQIYTLAASGGSGETFTFSIWVKSNTGSSQSCRVKLTHGGVLDNFLDITATTSWVRQTITVTNGIAVGSSMICGVLNPVAGTSVDVLLWGAQLVNGSNAETYQRITDSDTYNSVGFPHYLQYDGVDDFMVTAASINLSATDAVTAWAGIQKTSDATAQIAFESGANVTSVNGTFGISAPNTAAAPSFTALSRGTIIATATDTPLAAPYKAVLTLESDISLGQISITANQRTKVTVSTSQGTGNFTSQLVNFGSRNGTGLFSSQYEYQTIALSRLATAQEIIDTKAYVNTKTGAY